MGTIRVLLVDDQSLFRGAVAALLARQPGIEVVAEAENGRVAVERAVEVRPDLVVMDVEMPIMDGVEAARLIREQVPTAKVIMLTVSEADEHVGRAMAHGAHGYLLKNLHPHQLFDMVTSVMAGANPVSPAVAGRAAPHLAGEGGVAAPTVVPEDPGLGLTRREVQTLRLVAEGLSNKGIAEELGIAEGTVKNHVRNALGKLRMTNRTQAAAYVVRQGLGRPDPPPGQV